MYRSMIGSLLYLNSSRPDVSFWCVIVPCINKIQGNYISLLSKISFNMYIELHVWDLVSNKYKIFLFKHIHIKTWEGVNLIQKGTSKGYQYLNGRLVSWQSKKQKSVSIFTSYTEYIVVSDCTSQVI